MMLLCAGLIALPACSGSSNKEDDKAPAEVSAQQATPPSVTGMSYARSEKSSDEASKELEKMIEGKPALSVVGNLDHATNASENADMEMRDTRVIFFGNPALGTPLMQRNQMAGIDLPQHMLFYEEEAGDVWVTYNNTQYLSSRHGLEGVETLPKIDEALRGMAEGASGGSVVAPPSSEVAQGEGLKTVESPDSVEMTYARLKTAIESNEGMEVAFEVNHSKNAREVGMELRMTRLIVFGAAKTGSPIIKSQQTMGLDLPQKMLVWEDEQGVTHITYNDPMFLAQRHGVKMNEAQLQKMAEALSSLVKKASTPAPATPMP